MSILDSQFEVTDNAIYLKRTEATISSCSFTGISSTVNALNEFAGGVEFEEVAFASITSSNFTSLKGKGGAFKISSNPFFKEQNSDVYYTITNSLISD